MVEPYHSSLICHCHSSAVLGKSFSIPSAACSLPLECTGAIFVASQVFWSRLHLLNRLLHSLHSRLATFSPAQRRFWQNGPFSAEFDTFPQAWKICRKSPDL